jgi:heat shock protein HslJ/uncharacterized lipoprotein YbaY
MAEADPAQPLAIKGALTYPARTALPPDATAVVELRDNAAGEGRVVAERRITLGGAQVPIPFEFAIDRAKLVEGRAYAVRGGVVVEGRPAWATEPVPIDPKAARIDVGTLTMTPVRAEAFVSKFRCGDQPVSIGFTRDTMRMTVGAETFDMRQVVAASGAKYEAANDPSTTFWSKGKSAMVTVRGRAYPECALGNAGAKPFRATGNEPGWRLDLDERQMTLTADYGNTRVVAPQPAVETTADGKRYVASTREGPLAVTVRDQRCADTMTGMPYPNTVVVQFGGRTLNGCGGDPASLLQGAEWVVEDINRAGTIDRSRATLRFGVDGRLGGGASCNTYTAQYSITGEGLTISNAASTMMACAPAVMQQERLFLDVLAKTQRFSITPDGVLILHADGGRTITARRG